MNTIRFTLFFLLYYVPASISAQIDYNTYPKSTNCLFFDNVFIHEDGNTKEYLGDIVIRNGLIANVGIQIEKPYDAIKIGKDSMHVYPGFINYHSFIKSEKRDKSKDGKKEVKFRGAPPNDVAGITPERTIDEEYNSNIEQTEKLRKAGFAISQFSSDEGMLPGYTSIYLLNGDKNAQLGSAVHLFSQFKGAGRYYPSTIIGIMAKWRNLYEEAKLHKSYLSIYEKSKAGLEKPSKNITLEAFFPVIDGKSEVIFNTPKKLHPFRALTLSNDLGIPVTLINLGDVHELIPSFKGNFEIVLSSNLPAKMDEIDSTRLENDQEYSELVNRKKKAILSAYENAGKIEQLNKLFAFSMSGSDPSKLKENILIMLDHGLSKESALNALTVVPAKMLEIDDITGSIAKNKIGNLVITNGDYFTKDSEIKMVIVEGQKFEYKSDVKGEGKTTVNLEGDWTVSVDIGGEVETATMTIKKSNAKNTYDITLIQVTGEKASAWKLMPNGNKLNFKIKATLEGNSLPLEFDIDFKEESFSGSVLISNISESQSFPVEGTLISRPNNY